MFFKWIQFRTCLRQGDWVKSRMHHERIKGFLIPTFILMNFSMLYMLHHVEHYSAELNT